MSLLSIHKMLFTTLLLLLPFADLISAGPVPANIAKTLGLKLSPGAAILSPSDGAIFVNHSSRFSEFHTATAAVVVSIANELDVVTTVCTPPATINLLASLAKTFFSRFGMRTKTMSPFSHRTVDMAGTWNWARSKTHFS